MSTGYLIVNTYMADGALPVEGVLVRIFGAEEINRTEVHSRITNSDGITAPVDLPTSERGLSEKPAPREQPYALYNVELLKDGYYTKSVNNIAIFADVTTLLPVNMILSNGDAPAPLGSTVTYSFENSNLE